MINNENSFLKENNKGTTRNKIINYKPSQKSTLEVIKKINNEDFSEDENIFMTTLYLTEQNSRITIENERFFISKNNIILFSIPTLKIQQIVSFGNIIISSQVNSYCLIKNIPIIYLSKDGSYKGRLISDSYNEIRHIKHQIIFTNNYENKLKISKEIVKGKIQNYHKLCNQVFPQYEKEINSLKEYIDIIDSSDNIEQLLGYEGYTSSIYFQILKGEFQHLGFKKREKRPPTDMLNSLLSFGYTILYSNIISIMFSNGINPYIGVLHTDSPNHASLSSDIMEEFRAFAIDKPLLESLKNNEFTSSDFTIKENKAWYLNYEAKKRYLSIIESNFNKKFFHHEYGFNVNIKRMIDLQVKSIMQLIYDKKLNYQAVKF